MPQFNTLEEYQRLKAERCNVVNSERKDGGGLAESEQNSQNLWQSARKSFYYHDNASKAAELCSRIIAQFALSEEADEAKLLLYVIGIESKKLTEAPVKDGNAQHIEKKIVFSGKKTKQCLYCSTDVLERDMECKHCREFVDSVRKESTQETAPVTSSSAKKTKIPIVITVVALPIIGVAKGGILGIGLPEIVALLITGCVFWGTSKIRNLVYKYFSARRPRQRFRSL